MSKSRLKEVLKENRDEIEFGYARRADKGCLNALVELFTKPDPRDAIENIDIDNHPFLALLEIERAHLKHWWKQNLETAQLDEEVRKALDETRRKLEDIKIGIEASHHRTNHDLRAKFIRLFGELRACEHILEETDGYITGWLFEEIPILPTETEDEVRRLAEEAYAVTRMYIGTQEDLMLIAKTFFGIEKPFSTGRLEGARTQVIAEYGEHHSEGGATLREPGFVANFKVSTK